MAMEEAYDTEIDVQNCASKYCSLSFRTTTEDLISMNTIHVTTSRFNHLAGSDEADLPRLIHGGRLGRVSRMLRISFDVTAKGIMVYETSPGHLSKNICDCYYRTQYSMAYYP